MFDSFFEKNNLSSGMASHVRTHLKLAKNRNDLLPIVQWLVDSFVALDEIPINQSAQWEFIRARAQLFRHIVAQAYFRRWSYWIGKAYFKIIANCFAQMIEKALVVLFCNESVIENAYAFVSKQINQVLFGHNDRRVCLHQALDKFAQISEVEYVMGLFWRWQEVDEHSVIYHNAR